LSSLQLRIVVDGVIFVERDEAIDSLLVGAHAVLKVDGRALIFDVYVARTPFTVSTGEVVELSTPGGFQ
jgi:hypothetical protein